MEDPDNPLQKHEGRELPAPLLEVKRDDLLLHYQQKALGEVSRAILMIVEKGRRIGLTWAIAADAVVMAAASARAGGNNVFYVSYTADITREFIDTCAMWARAFMNISAQVGEFMFEDEDEAYPGETKHIKAFRIEFASGFVIQALSSRPRSIRGRQGLVIIDEAAFCDKLAELLKSAMALIIWGARIVVISTHDGAENPFNQLIEDIKSGKQKGNHIRITFDDAVADGLYERVRLCGKHNGMEKQEWIDSVYAFYGDNADEELRCIPKTGAGCYLDPADISACEHEDAGKPEKYEGNLSVIGRDVARRRDLAVIWPFEITKNGHLWLRERYEMTKVKFADQDAAFERMFEKYRVMRACIDQTGMGEKVVEDLQTAKGTDRIVGVIMSPTNRLNVAIALKKRIEEHTIHFPPAPEIRADFKAIKKSKGTGDSIRLVNDETVHADMFWAAGLACIAAETDPLTCRGFIAVPKTAGKFDMGGDDGDGTFRMRADEQPSGSGRGSW